MYNCHRCFLPLKNKTFDRNNVTFTFWSLKLTEAQSSELFCTKFI